MPIRFRITEDRFAVWTGASSTPRWQAGTDDDNNWNIVTLDSSGNEVSTPGALADFDNLLSRVAYRAADSKTGLTVDIRGSTEPVSGGSSAFDDSFIFEGIDGPGAERAVMRFDSTARNVFRADEMNAAGDDVVTFKGTHTGLIRLSEGTDTVRGSEGAEVIVAGAGDDIIEGGGGADRTFGRDGADTFVFKAGDSTCAIRDTIADFSNSGGDKIDLSAVASSFSSTGCTGTAGEVIVINSRVKVDIDGDGNADMNILVRGDAVGVDDFIF